MSLYPGVCTPGFSVRRLRRRLRAMVGALPEDRGWYSSSLSESESGSQSVSTCDIDSDIDSDSDPEDPPQDGPAGAGQIRRGCEPRGICGFLAGRQTTIGLVFLTGRPFPGFAPRPFLFHPSGVAFRSLPRRFGSDHAGIPGPPLATLKGSHRRAQGANPGKDGVSLEVQP